MKYLKTVALSGVACVILAGCVHDDPIVVETLHENSAKEGTPISLGELIPQAPDTATVETDPEVPVSEGTDLTPVFDTTKRLVYDVPFTSQAPDAQWDVQIYQDGCEEASMIMAMKWVHGDTSLSKSEANREIAAMSDYEMKEYGFNLDVSSADTVRASKGYFGYDNISLKENITTQNIIDELYAGNLVVIAVNGKKLFNPNFSDGGPENHMLPIIGYDPQKKEFITNDPGTRRGAGYVYSQQVIENALRDYPSGYHEPNPTVEKMMIVIEKE